MIHTRLWTDMFVLTLPIVEKIVRPVLIYLFLSSAYAWQENASWRS